MPAYKNEKTGNWYASFYYTDWQGQRKKKKKEGFKLKRDAQEFEREFLSKQSGSCDMTFSSLVDLYIEDITPRIRLSTLNHKTSLINRHILPYFGEMVCSGINPATIRKWQNEMMSKGYEATYLRHIHAQLSAVFNFAVNYYNLKENPCTRAGGMGRSKADTMSFWTLDEYKKFISVVNDFRYKVIFETLYWTGMRVGELRALTPDDIDFKNKTISITKSHQRIHKQDIITEPKTPKSRRVIEITSFLCNDIDLYINKMYNIKKTERLFVCTLTPLHYILKKYCSLSNVKVIRIHDIRHSHASLLVELGFSPLAISERLGHEDIQTTLNTYSHLYPNKKAEIVAKLEGLND